MHISNSPCLPLFYRRAGTFLVNMWPLRDAFPAVLRFLRHYVFSFARWSYIARLATMGMLQRFDSKTSPAPAPRERRMLALKTKEECRQGNETLQVWTVELPSKHAEGILKCVASRPSIRRQY